MQKLSVTAMIEAGVHFGHRVSRWNPRMAKYIYGKRNLIHIINLKETVRGLARACHFVSRLSASGQQVVFVGTKRQIKEVIETGARQCSMPFVTERWLGGTLTNFQTIHGRLKHLENLEEMDSTGKMELYSKKMQASLQRELSRIKKNLDGIRELHRLPGALIVVDPSNENIAVKEANKLGIPVIAVLDTDCNPNEVDIPIPANDDAIRAVELILEPMIKAVMEGKANFSEKAAMEARAAQEGEQFELASQLRRQQMQAQRAGRGGGKPRGGGRGPGGPGGPGGRGPGGPGGRGPGGPGGRGPGGPGGSGPGPRSDAKAAPPTAAAAAGAPGAAPESPAPAAAPAAPAAAPAAPAAAPAAPAPEAVVTPEATPAPAPAAAAPPVEAAPAPEATPAPEAAPVTSAEPKADDSAPEADSAEKTE